MAVITAAAGGGNWSVGSTWVGGVAPTAADDAVLVSTSGNVVIDSGSVARSLNCSTGGGYTGTLTHTAGVTLTLGDATAGAGNVALKLVAGMTYTAPGTGGWGFVSTSATQQTITMAGKAMPGVTINGGGCSYLLGDGLTISATQTLTLGAGTFNTGNFACSWGLFVISSATAKTLTLGSSAIAITGNSATAVNYSGSNATFTANTATMTFSGASAGIVGAANWNGLSLVFANTVGDARLVTGPTVANVTVNGIATKVGQFTIQGANATITSALVVAGNSTVNRVLFRSDVTGTSRTVTVGTSFTLSNTDFTDITAAGAAGTWTGTSMGNALGNSNITFDTPATQTRSGAGGNWSTAGNWTSRVPLPQDNVVINAGASGTITADMPRLGADIDFTGFVGTAAFNSTANTIYGSINLASGMTVSGTSGLTFAARSAKSITSNGRTFTQALFILAPSGTYTIQDNLIINRDQTGGTLTLTQGTLTVNNVNVSLTGTNSAYVSAAFTITNAGTGTWFLGATAALAPWFPNPGATVNASSTNFVISTASASARQWGNAGAFTYGTLTYTVAGSTGSLTITGSNTFGTINFSDASNARSLLFTAATNTSVTNWNVFGTSGKLMTVDTSTAATHTLTKLGGGVISSDYLSVKNSLAGPATTWYAGTHSTDAGGNTGWIFTDPATGAGRRSLMGVGI